MTDFEAFWTAYPRHVGKLAASKAYVKARLMASAAEILAGVELYKRTKPAYADWCHPTSWLNQGRWLDEPDVVPSRTASRLVDQGPSARDLELIAKWEREHGKAAS